jgi:hypothetical protein
MTGEIATPWDDTGGPDSDDVIDMTSPTAGHNRTSGEGELKLLIPNHDGDRSDNLIG